MKTQNKIIDTFSLVITASLTIASLVGLVMIFVLIFSV
jgi:hypothetical protein